MIDYYIDATDAKYIVIWQKYNMQQREDLNVA